MTSARRLLISSSDSRQWHLEPVPISDVVESRLAAANQVHNFESISAGDERRPPLPSWNNFEISLNGKPIRRQTKLSHELRDVQSLRHFVRFTVHLYGHGFAHLSIWAFGLQLIAQLLETFAHVSAYDQCGERGLVESWKRKLQRCAALGVGLCKVALGRACSAFDESLNLRPGHGLPAAFGGNFNIQRDVPGLQPGPGIKEPDRQALLLDRRRFVQGENSAA